VLPHPPLSEYELLREHNIKRNNAVLSSLNLQTFAVNKKDQRKKTTATVALSKTVARKKRVLKQSVVTDSVTDSDDNNDADSDDNNDNLSICSQVEWDYRVLTDAQKSSLPPSVSAKVGKSFVDR
jgi:hypothetical protein